MAYEDAMREAVERNGGKIEAEEYLLQVQAILQEQGGDPAIDSLKTNAFNHKRMTDAGVARVQIGRRKMVWLEELAESVLTGEQLTMDNLNGTPITTNITSAPAPTSGAFMGILRADPTDYPEYISEFIPTTSTNFVESPQGEMEKLALAYRLGWDVMYEGPTGCGKTRLIADFCYATNRPMIRLNCSEGLNEDNFIGYKTLVNGEVVFIEGPALLAMKYGCVLVLDELNAALPEILIKLHSIMDSRTYTLAEDGNRMITATDGFMVAACINPPNDYAGVRPLNRATKDRFDLQMNIQYLPAADEAKLIQRLSGNRNRDLARTLVQMANDLRELKTQRKLQSDTSTRTLITVMQACQHMSLTDAINYTMVNRYQDSERRDIEMAARARLAEY